MTTEPVKKGITVRVKLALASLMGLLALVGSASAVTYPLNESVAPIIIGITALMVPILAVILGVLPIIITMAIIGFILALLAKLLGGMDFK